MWQSAFHYRTKSLRYEFQKWKGLFSFPVLEVSIHGHVPLLPWSLHWGSIMAVACGRGSPFMSCHLGSEKKQKEKTMVHISFEYTFQMTQIPPTRSHPSELPSPSSISSGWGLRLWHTEFGGTVKVETIASLYAMVVTLATVPTWYKVDTKYLWNEAFKRKASGLWRWPSQ